MAAFVGMERSFDHGLAVGVRRQRVLLPLSGSVLGSQVDGGQVPMSLGKVRACGRAVLSHTSPERSPGVARADRPGSW